MKKKTIKAIKSFERLSPAEKVATVAISAAVFPIALTLGVYKQSQKKKRRRRR